VTRPVSPQSAGFTLVELMVAFLIFALLAAAGVALLSFSVRAQEVTTAKLDDIAALNRVSAALSADFAQAADRPARAADGTRLPAFVGSSAGEGRPFVELVRRGWTNPDGAPRADVQKVAYQLRGGVLERIAYPMLDGAAPLPPAPMLSGVTSLSARYRAAGAWSDSWSGTPASPLPDAAELTITRRDGHSYRMMFLVGTAFRLPVNAKGQPGAS